MTIRHLPQIKAFDAPRKGSYEAPSSAYENWHPVRAASKSDDRTVNIYDEIGDNWEGTGMTARIVNSVLRRADGDAITVNVNSPGGDFFEGVTIYNMLREYEGAVNVNVLGLAASAASVIVMAADELRIAENCTTMMIHNSWGMVIGNQDDMRAAADTFAVFDKAMASVYAARSELDQETIAALMAKDHWMTGEEAVENGFADAFLKSDEIVEDEQKSTSAKHRIDKALAKQGVPRSERRAMFKQIISGTQNATAPTMQNAGDLNGVLNALSKLRTTVKGNQ